MNELVFVSGASGFVASYIVKELLQAGYRVRGSVRDAKKKESYAHLSALPGAAERLEMVSAELTTPNAFDEHVKGATYVLHTASPYVLEVKDAQRDLIDPAVMGTTTMMDACAKAEGIKRVVITSSSAAVTDEPITGYTFSEKDWNTKSTLVRNPYYMSKARAEKVGWDFIDAKKPAWDLVVVNPAMVTGPAMTKAINTSNQLFVDLAKGQYPAIVSLMFGMVDVRDVAVAHVEAMRRPNAKGRYICVSETKTMRDVVSVMRDNGWKGTKIPSLRLDSSFGTALGRLAAYMQPRGVRSYLQTNLGRELAYDNSKIKNDLGMKFMSADASVLDTLKDLAKWGHIPPAS